MHRNLLFTVRLLPMNATLQVQITQSWTYRWHQHFSLKGWPGISRASMNKVGRSLHR